MKLSIVLLTVFSFLVGCSASVAPSPLTESDWIVERIIVADSVIEIEGVDHPSLSFNLDSTFNGQTMCNSLSGLYYTTPSGGISMSIETISTAFCPENTIEGIFIEQIAMSHYFKMIDDTLHFADNDGRTIISLSQTPRVNNSNN